MLHMTCRNPYLVNYFKYKVHEARDEIPVKYYQKLNIALFCICAPLGIYANMQVKEVSKLLSML